MIGEGSPRVVCRRDGDVSIVDIYIYPVDKRYIAGKTVGLVVPSVQVLYERYTCMNDEIDVQLHIVYITRSLFDFVCVVTLCTHITTYSQTLRFSLIMRVIQPNLCMEVNYHRRSTLKIETVGFTAGHFT